MQTEHPSVEIYFVFAFTFCKVRVYEVQELFIRKVLKTYKVEFLEPDASKDWQDIDTRVLLDLVSGALPKLLANAGLTGSFMKLIADTLELRSMSD